MTFWRDIKGKRIWSGKRQRETICGCSDQRQHSWLPPRRFGFESRYPHFALVIQRLGCYVANVITKVRVLSGALVRIAQMEEHYHDKVEAEGSNPSLDTYGMV